MSGDDVSCGVSVLGEEEAVLTATSGDSGDVEGEGIMSLYRVDGILRRVGGNVVEGGEGPCLDGGHGLRQAGREEEEGGGGRGE